MGISVSSSYCPHFLCHPFYQHYNRKTAGSRIRADIDVDWCSTLFLVYKKKNSGEVVWNLELDAVSCDFAAEIISTLIEEILDVPKLQTQNSEPQTFSIEHFVNSNRVRFVLKINFAHFIAIK